jgi:hypothetical protein
MSTMVQRFTYLWAKCRIQVTSIKKLFVVTLLVSILVFVYGVFPTWNEQFNNRHATGNIALLEAASKLLVRLQ